jgi:tape measure domain-containing protein
MAAPAAVLSILVKANTGPATTGLVRLNTQLEASDSTAKSAAKSIGRVAAATAAIGAVGVGAGLAKIVKDGVAFNATMESSELALKRFLGGSKNAQRFLDDLFETAKRTPFEFTQLTEASRRLLAFGMTAEDTKKTLDAVGDAVAAAGGNGESIDKVTLALGQMQAKGKVSAEELLQLTEAGIPAYKILKDELGLTGEQVANIGNEGISANKAIGALVNGMEAKFGGAAQEQAKTWSGMVSSLKDNWAQMTGAMTVGLFDEVKKWGPVVNGALEDITDIWKQTDLPLGEKIQRSINRARIVLDPIFARLSDALDNANIPEKIGRAISVATPIILEAMAKAGAGAARAFVTAFAESDVWGKLVLGGWLFSRMGGVKGFFGMGATAGRSFGAGMATTGGGLFAGGIKSGVKGALKGAAKLGGKIAALDLAINLVDSNGNPIAAFVNTAHDLTFGIVPKIDVKSGAEKADAQVQAVSDQLDRMVKARNLTGISQMLDKIHALRIESNKFDDKKGVRAFDELSRRGGIALERLREQQRRTGTASDNFAANLRGLRLKGSKDFDRLANNVVDGSRKIKRLGGDNVKQTRIEIARQFDIARQRVKKAMDDKVVSVKEGTSRLRDLARKELKLYGISAGRVDVVLAKGANGQMRPHQKGSYINEGRASGDSVPALLERGEYVLNRNAVKKVGKQALDKLNYAQAPRFQSGGIVELLHPGNDANHQDHLHIATATQDAIVAIGKRLQKLGWLVGEHPAFGGVSAVHTSGSYHYSGRAIDVNWPLAAEEKAKIAALLPMLGGSLGGLGRVFEGLKRPQIRGPASAALEAAQGALDRIHSAANAQVASIVNVDEGMEGLGNFTGPWTKVMAKIAQAKGWSLSDWRALVMKESGGNPAARNPSSGAYGLGQFLGGTARAYAKYGALSSDGSDQIRAMAQYISDRYKTPSAALAFHNAHNWYREGGLVGMDAGGDPMARAATPTTAGKQPRRQPVKQKFPKGLAKLVKKYTAGKSAKVRKNTMKKILEQAGDIGLPVKMRKALKTHSESASDFGEFADRAASLTDETSITEALQAEMERRQALNLPFPDVDQQAMVNGMVGKVGGKTQLDWLKDQLTALFNWRNAMIDAREKIRDLREKVHKAIEMARKRLKEIQESLKNTNKRKKDLEERLEKLQKHPKRNKEAIKATKDELKTLKTPIGVREGIVENLKGKILPALTGRRDMLNTRSEELLTSISEVQGRGSNMRRWSALPAMSETGGTIFDTRLKIAELTDKPIRVTAEAATDTTTPDTAAGTEELRELLRQANLRTAVSQAQYQVFKNMPTFATGGIVPGSANAPRVIEAHAGEGVFTRDQMAAMGSGNITVIVHDGAVKSDYIEVLAGKAADRAMRTSSRRASRGLPSAGGGLRG